MSDDAICPNCKRNTELVFDRSSGHAICSECGLVLVLEFANESADIDPVRGLSWSSLARLHNRGTTNLDRSLILAFKTIATMCDRLGLVRTIMDRACEIFKKVEDQKKSIRSGKNQDATLAACLYIACRQENKPRTVKEIFSAANGATKTDIRRVIKQLELQMGQSVAMRKLHAGDFMRRFCSNLCLGNQTVKAAQESVQKLQEFDIRRSAFSIAAGIIYIVTQLSDCDKKPLKDVALATGVAQGTVRNSYKDLYPYLTKIIPTWYAQEQDIKNLSRPLNSHIVI